VYVGCDDGLVHVLDDSLRVFKAFVAHQRGVAAVFSLPGGGLATLGHDDPSHPLNGCSLKTWDLGDRGSPTATLASSLSLFPLRGGSLSRERLPDATVSAAALCLAPDGPTARPAADPLAGATLLVALSDGSVTAWTGDLRQPSKAVRAAVSPPDAGDGCKRAVHAILVPRDSGEGAPVAFLVSPGGVAVATLPLEGAGTIAVRDLGDAGGCEPGQCCLGADGSLVVLSGAGGATALQTFTPEGRGACLALDRPPRRIWGVCGCVAAVVPGEGGDGEDALRLYDLELKMAVGAVAAAPERLVELGGGGSCLAVGPGARLHRLSRLPAEDCLRLLLERDLYAPAVDLATGAGLPEATVAGARRRWAHHLLARGEGALATEQFLAAAGHVQPAAVIWLLLGLRQAPSLVAYLEGLHSLGRATRDHTTLLLHCYAHVGGDAQLDRFLCGGQDLGKALWWLAGSAPPEARARPRLAHDVDPDAAVSVLRQTGHLHHALFVAAAAERHDLVLRVLAHDLGQYPECIRFIRSLPLDQALGAVAECGGVLLDQAAEETTEMLASLCLRALAEDAAPGAGGGAPLRPGERRPPRLPTELLDLFVPEGRPGHPRACARFCRQLLGSGLVRRHPAQVSGLVHELAAELLLAWRAARAAGGPARAEEAEAMGLLREHWGPGTRPEYDPDDMLRLCRGTGFLPGVAFLFERQRLLRHALLATLEGGDVRVALDAAQRLADPRAGGDGALWGDLLRWLAWRRARGCGDDGAIPEALRHVGGLPLLVPPQRALAFLGHGAGVPLGEARSYLAALVGARCLAVEEDVAAAERLRDEAAASRREAHGLKYDPRSFSGTRSSVSRAPLALPVRHFWCGHSVNEAELGDEDGCPLCAPQQRGVAGIRASMRPTPALAERIEGERRAAPDRAAVSAEFVGAGALGAVWEVLRRDGSEQARREREILLGVLADRFGDEDLALDYVQGAAASTV